MPNQIEEFKRRAKQDPGLAREELAEDMAYAWREYAEQVRVLAEASGLPFNAVLHDLMTDVANQFSPDGKA